MPTKTPEELRASIEAALAIADEESYGGLVRADRNGDAVASEEYRSQIKIVADARLALAVLVALAACTS